MATSAWQKRFSRIAETASIERKKHFTSRRSHHFLAENDDGGSSEGFSVKGSSQSTQLFNARSTHVASQSIRLSHMDDRARSCSPSFDFRELVLLDFAGLIVGYPE